MTILADLPTEVNTITLPGLRPVEPEGYYVFDTEHPDWVSGDLLGESDGRMRLRFRTQSDRDLAKRTISGFGFSYQPPYAWGAAIEPDKRQAFVDFVSRTGLVFDEAALAIMRSWTEPAPALVPLTREHVKAIRILRWRDSRVFEGRYVGAATAHCDVRIQAVQPLGQASDTVYLTRIEDCAHGHSPFAIADVRISAEIAKELEAFNDSLRESRNHGADGTRNLSGQFRSALRREERKPAFGGR